jgi:nucleotide-binding universal stress UspA family protein
VVERTDRPVLIVGAQTHFSDWNRRPLHVTAAIDFGITTSQAVIQGVEDLRALGACDVAFVHASAPPLANEDAERMFSALDEALWRRARALPGEGAVSFHLRGDWGTTRTTLARAARAYDADLVVVAGHQRRGLDWLLAPSVTQDLLREDPHALLFLPVRGTSPERAVTLSSAPLT